MKCIAHIDMDCFYAQVEAVRLGVNCRQLPFIVSQWGSLIAVNYPARALGISRFTSLLQAQEICPDVLVGNVATYKVGESEYHYHSNPTKQTHKVALEPYREASRRIFDIICTFDGIIVEKGSVDEAYVDVTEAARRELSALRTSGADGEMTPESVREASTKVIEDRTEEMSRWLAERGTTLEAVYDGPMRALKRRSDAAASGDGSRGFSVRTQATPEEDAEYTHNCLLLCAATRVVQRIRDRIYEELRYDCSAGIAHNKLLAKCISATHKPNQQTLLLPDGAASALFDMPFSRLRGFGGKFGDTVREVCGGVELCREAWLVSLPQMCLLDVSSGACSVEADDTVPGVKRKRGEKGVATSEYAFFRIRGYGEDVVATRFMTKTLMASKNFSPATCELDDIRRWLVVLCGELSSRYEELAQWYHVKGQNLNIKLGSGGLYNIGNVFNHTVVLPAEVTPETLLNAATREVKNTLMAFPTRHDTPLINSVTVTIGGLVPAIQSDKRQQSILSLMQTAKANMPTTKDSVRTEVVEVETIESSLSRSGSIIEEGSGCTTDRPHLPLRVSSRETAGEQDIHVVDATDDDCSVVSDNDVVIVESD